MSVLIRTENVASIGLQLYKEAILTLFTARGTTNSKKIIPPINGSTSKNKIT